ncbi:hypothetical protein CORC01_10258, partial [Colletotrichum orchidophilum]
HHTKHPELSPGPICSALLRILRSKSHHHFPKVRDPLSKHPSTGHPPHRTTVERTSKPNMAGLVRRLFRKRQRQLPISSTDPLSVENSIPDKLRR